MAQYPFVAALVIAFSTPGLAAKRYYNAALPMIAGS